MARFIAGRSSGAVKTGTSLQTADRRTAVVTVEGPIGALKSANPADYVPAGYELDTSNVTPNGNGLGKLTVNCIRYEDGDSFEALRTTFSVDMQEVQYDLEDHPYLASVRDKILMWLATEESKCVDGNTFRYMDANGELQPIEEDEAIKFCRAYMAGIKTFNRYYPVIEKISYWSNPPGLSRSGKSFTGGTPLFSSNAGKYATPPISLNGYPATNWFKSHDKWTENGNKTWTRTEQWTWTPDGSDSELNWIYANSNAQQNNE